MKLATLFFWAVPIFSLGVYSLYYVNNPNNWTSYYGPLAITNSDLILDLNKSKVQGYTTELKGYESSITKTSYSYPHTERNKTKEEDGISKINKIQEYSVKLQTPCGSGTGWFLDYVLPENGKYPTKWFVATNAHVVDGMSFGVNPYKQELPINWRYGCAPNYYNGHTPLGLFKEKTNSHSIIRNNPDNFLDLIAKKFSASPEQYEDMQNVEYYYGDKDPEIVYYIERSPKLFYASINYLGANPRSLGYQWTISNYYKDFAVLEINFPTERAAKLLTRDFYSKYDLTIGTNKANALDLFAPELLQEKTSDQLFSEEEDYFMSGYASNGDHPYKSSGNYSKTHQRASRLTYLRLHDGRRMLSLKNKDGSEIIGHADSGRIDETFGGRNTLAVWNGKYHNNWGYNYLLDNTWLGAGASGSLTTDSKGKVIGLYRMHDDLSKQGYVEPLRSKGIYKNGKIIYPKYDLIEGATGQISSFKDQVKRYYLSNNKSTGLSRYRNWK